MKKYYSIAFALCSAASFAQQAISFEDDEGFVPGNIHGQEAWISTPTGGVPENVINQTVSTENATAGNRSLKIVKESVFGTQAEPIIGGFYNISAPLAFTNFSVSFDISMSQLNGSVFGFQAVNNVEEQFVVRIDFDKTGVVKILDTTLGIVNLVSTPEIWSPNTWYRVKVVGTAMDIRYYVNNSLIYIGSAVSPLHIDQLRFVHDNALGTAYIDAIKINNEPIMNVKEYKANDKTVSLYPNPATDFVKINTLNTIREVKVYDVSGKRIDVQWEEDTIDIRHLPSGSYLLNINTTDMYFTEKIIKK